MAKIRSDLKAAMKAKDTTRLNVLRAIISETNNASKTSSPIRTDLQLLSLIRKRVTAATDASQQFLAANRADLKEKEDRQIEVLQEYAGRVQTMDIEEIRQAVSETVSRLQNEGKKADLGSILKALFSPGGSLDGKPAERAEVARVVKDIISGS
jgi:hypothetical protein